MMDTPAVFERDRYVVLPSLLKEPQLSQYYRYAGQLANGGLMQLDREQVPGAPFSYGDFMMDGLLDSLKPEAERTSGLSLYPTYSLVRLYRMGDTLKRHKDRPSCEISITLCLGFQAGEPWPIWIETPRGTFSVDLKPGDGLLYRGVECPHWRDKLDGDHVAQVFLHYVDQNGPYKEWKFDKRRSLADLTPSVSQR